MSANNGFQFLPRSEAHAMAWEELLPPVRRAVRDLLVRLKGAEQAANADDAASCFLVYGTRGTGKTTVLYSVKHAIFPEKKYRHKPFFANTENKQCLLTEQDKLLRKDAEYCAESLKNTLWLDILDLEALPLKNNLLTTLLTRVRNALDSPDCDKIENPLTSPFEEAADSARQQLNSLINDATLMWEDICEMDTRSRANREVAAADIYANFRCRFEKAMDKLSTELGKSRGRREDEYVSIVLPIDNIDRSTEHLHSIIKLAQLVSHRRLWLVLAGDREDINAFLERAYWKELMANGNLITIEKKGVYDEDETFAMARRQSAAALQKFLPQSHRVEIGLVRPLETLQFCPSHMEATIYDLLQAVSVPTSHNQRTEGNGRIKLLDLFYFKRFIGAGADGKGKPSENDTGSCGAHIIDAGEYAVGAADAVRYVSYASVDYIKRPSTDKLFSSSDDEEYLTAAGKKGLLLPARGVVDLWQLAYLARHDSLLNDLDFRAEKIARTMLRSSMDISKMSSRMSRLLQGKAIHRAGNEGTSLDWSSIKLNWGNVTVLSFQIYVPCYALPTDKDQDRARYSNNSPAAKASNNSESRIGWTIQSNLYAHSIGDVYYWLDFEQKQQREDLTDVVAAWLISLNDILLLAEPEAGSIVINGAPPPGSRFITVNHELAMDAGYRGKVSVTWPLPKWKTFLLYDVFGYYWHGFIQAIKKHLEVETESQRPVVLMMIAGWVILILQTYIADSSEAMRSIKSDVSNISTKVLDVNKWIHFSDKDVVNMLRDVLLSAMQLYSAISQPHHNNIKNENSLEREDIIRCWLESELPLLLSNVYAVAGGGIGFEEDSTALTLLKEMIITEIIAKADGGELVRHWKKCKSFILSDISRTLQELFCGEGDTAKLKNTKPPKWKMPDESDPTMLWALGALAPILGINESQSVGK